MTGGPHLASEPRRRRRGAFTLAVLAALGVLAGQAPASGQSPGQPEPPRPCTSRESELRDSCANLPLDAYRTLPPAAPTPGAPPLTNPLRPVGRPVALTSARVGQVYPPAQLAIGGVRPYSVRTFGLPPSMHVNAEGFLVGRPAAGDGGDHPFGVVVQDSSGQEIRQYYRLRILGGGGGAAPRPVRPREPAIPGPVLTPIKVPDTRAEPAYIDGRVTVYVLRNADLLPPLPAAPVLAAGAPAPKPPPAANVPPPPPPPPPTVIRSAGGKVTLILPLDTPQSAAYPADLATRARGMINVEYPSRDLFKRALAADYAAAPLSPTQLDKVADAAVEYRYFARAPKLNWAPEAGCGCAVPVGQQAKTIYGFFPFWRSEEPPPSIVFSKVSRIGFLGVQLSNDGSWTRPSGYSGNEDQWWRQTSTFARAAQAHGARLDLVLQRSDWGFLARMDPIDRTALYESAARTAVGLADTRLRNRGAGVLLLPFWKEPKYVFDGITVMFDYPTGASADEIDAYVHFHDGFIRELIRAMQATKRDYVLNIVAPDPLGPATAAQGLGGSAMSEASIWRAFLSYKRMAEPQRFHRAAPPEDKVRFLGRTKIRVNLLAPLREPTGASKKALRASIDSLTDVRGYNRVAVLQSILPILYLPSGEGPFEEPPPGVKAKPKPKAKAVVRTKPDKTQLDDDIIYFRQNFGGVAMWPTPIQKVGIGDEVYDDLQRIFYQTDAGPLAAVTSQVICSLLLRLLWQALVLVTIVAAAAYVIWGQGSGRAKLYRRGLFTLGVALFALSFFLLTVDPALAAVSRSNIPLFGLVAVALGGAGWRAAKPKIPRP